MGFLIQFAASIFVFGIIIFVHELGHFTVAKLSGIKVNEFSIGMGPKLFSKQKNPDATRYSIRALPIGGYVAMEGEDEESTVEDSFTSAPVQNRIAVVVAGAVMNLILGFVILTYLVNTQDSITSKKVSAFHENATTQQTGLQIDDEIIAVNGRRCFIANDILYEFARTKNGIADFTVKRDGKVTQLKDVTFDTMVDENGQWQIILDFYVYPQEKTFSSVLNEAVSWTLSFARLVFLSFVDLITGHVKMNEISGPVGIITVIGEAASYGFIPVLSIMALLTINLGIFNLMPFPALDGGRLMFLLIELIRGKAIKQKYEIWVNTAGMIILLTFMVFVTFSDVSKFFIK